MARLRLKQRVKFPRDQAPTDLVGAVVLRVCELKCAGLITDARRVSANWAEIRMTATTSGRAIWGRVSAPAGAGLSVLLERGPVIGIVVDAVPMDDGRTVVLLDICRPLTPEQLERVKACKMLAAGPQDVSICVESTVAGDYISYKHGF
jgi:hypothetical protein